MSWSTTPPSPIIKPGWTTDPTITPPPGQQQWEVRVQERLRGRLQPAHAAMVGEVRQSGALAAQLRRALFSGAGAQSQTGELDALLQPATFLGTNITLGQLAAGLQPAHATLTGGQQFAGTMGATLQPARAAAAAAQIHTGVLTAQLERTIATLTGTHGIPGTLAADLAEALMQASGGQTVTGTLAATLRRVLFVGAGTQQQTGALAATLQKALLAATGTVKSLVVLDDVSDGGSGGTSTRSWAHVNNGNCIVVGFSNSTGSAATCTYGGVNIPRVFGPTISGTVFPATGYYSVFRLISNSLPQGENTVSCTNAGTASSAGAVSFKNAGSFGTLISDTASGAINKSTALGEGSAAVAAYGGGGISFGAITPNEAVRYGFSAFVTWPHVIGYGLDTGSGITFNATQSSSKAGAVVPILPV